jgi:hypothetical protein
MLVFGDTVTFHKISTRLDEDRELLDGDSGPVPLLHVRRGSPVSSDKPQEWMLLFPDEAPSEPRVITVKPGELILLHLPTIYGVVLPF